MYARSFLNAIGGLSAKRTATRNAGCVRAMTVARSKRASCRALVDVLFYFLSFDQFLHSKREIQSQIINDDKTNIIIS